MATLPTKKQPILPAKKRNLLPLYLIIICITTCTLYYRSLKNDFLDLDDMTIVVNNYPFIKNFSNTPRAFKQGVFQLPGIKDTLSSYYRPMLTVSLMIDAHISPSVSNIPKPKPFLAANIFYHTVACILLLFLLLELNIPPLASFLLAILFTVHPILNQAVAWIPGRNDSLLAMFILASFVFLLKYIDKGKAVMVVLHVLFFLLALFTKENAIMLVPLSFLFLRSVNKKPVPGKTYFMLAIIYMVCIIPWFFMRQHALAGNGMGPQAIDSLKNLFHFSPYFLHYTGNIVLPFALSVMSSVKDTNYILGFAGIIIIGAGLLLSKNKRPELVIFGFVWFMLFLTPSILSSYICMEHRAYLPLVGVIIMVSQIDRIKKAQWAINDVGLWVSIGVFILFFGISVSHLKVFENRFKFDESAMEDSPNFALPCLYLAQNYDAINNYDSAIIAYREALRRDSNSPLVRNNIAGDYIKMKDYPDAEKELREDWASHPKSAITVFDLGLEILQSSFHLPDSLQKQKDSEAVALWKKSIQLDSGFVKPYNVLRQYYQATGDSAHTIIYRDLYLKKTKKYEN